MSAREFGWLDPTFVDGVGPPLEQLEEDYSTDGREFESNRDVLALIAEVKKLRAELVA